MGKGGGDSANVGGNWRNAPSTPNLWEGESPSPLCSDWAGLGPLPWLAGDGVPPGTCTPDLAEQSAVPGETTLLRPAPGTAESKPVQKYNCFALPLGPCYKSSSVSQPGIKRWNKSQRRRTRAPLPGHSGWAGTAGLAGAVTPRGGLVPCPSWGPVLFS